MALLPINVDSPIKEIVQSIYNETGLKTRVFYEQIELTDSNEKIRNLKFKKNILGLKHPQITLTDIISFHSSIQIYSLQAYIHQLFGIEIVFESDRKEINEFTCYNEIANLFIPSKNDSLEKLNNQLHQFFNSVKNEMVFQKENFENCYLKDSAILDFEIKIEMDFVLNENDRLFNDDSDNYVIKMCPWVLSDDLNRFKQEYIENEYLNHYDTAEIPCKNPHRILYKLLQELEIEDVYRIGSFFVDIHFIHQKKYK